MSTTTTARTAARTAALDRRTALQLAAGEYHRFLALLRSLTSEEWARPTDCPGWDVRAVAGHVLGQAEMVASVRQLARQSRVAARAGGDVDAVTAHQVQAFAGLSRDELVGRFAAVAPRAVRGRRLLATLLGRVPAPGEELVGERPERWTFGYMAEVVLTRDTWMHRVDVARATGRTLELSPGHDGVLVADIVAEWADRHGQPYRLRLTGPAGGTWSSGTDGAELELDAVDFCRLLSGRGEAPAGLLSQQVPF
ncbi:maleylpyruvate isomerase family mycothiol-dependent enzyme [Geodermatophilus sp. SYSU D00691]